MKKHAFFSILFIAFTTFQCAPKYSGKQQPKAIKGVLDLRGWDFEKDGPVKLDGEWEFYWKKFLADIKPDDNPAYIQPGKWNSFRHEGKTIGAIGYGTYRIRMLLSAKQPRLAMKTGYWYTSVRLMLPGRTHSIGKPGRSREDTLPVTRKDVVDFWRHGVDALLLVESANYFHRNGGMLEAPILDLAERLRARVNRERMWQGMLAAIFLLFGLYHLVLHALRRNQAVLWFGVFCLLMALRVMVSGEQIVHLWLPELDFRIDKRLEYLDLHMILSCLPLMLHALFPDEMPRLLRNLFVVAGLLFALTLFLPSETYTRLLIGLQMTILIFGVIMVVVPIRAALRGKPTALTFLFGFVVLTAGGVADIVINILYSFSPPFASIGLLGFIFAQAVVLSRRFAAALSKVEELSGGLHQRLSTIGQMASTIVHDLKNPMGIIKGYVELADDEDVSSEERKEYLGIIDAEVDRLSDMAFDILDFAKGDMNLNIQSHSLKEYMGEIYKFLKPNFAESGIELKLKLDYDGHLSFDANRFRRVILNLANNAKEAMSQGGKFSMALSKNETSVLFDFTDNGPGIPEEIQETLFEVFVTKGKEKGTGLGMSTVKNIVEAHGGEISFETKLGEGTRFTVSLPIKK